MRIKLTANSNVSLPAHLSNIDLSYGYTLFEHREVDTWKVQLAAGLDKALSVFKPLSTEQRDFIQSVTESVRFLDSSIPQSDSHIDHLQIQLNIKTPLNQGMLKIAELMHKFSNSKYAKQEIKDSINERVNDLSLMSNPYLGMIMGEQKIMHLGSEVFTANQEGNATYYIKENLGMQQATNFLVYHESAHAFEHTNTKNFDDNFSTLFRNIYDNTETIAHNPFLRNDLNDLISSNEGLGLNTLDFKYSHEITTLYKEIYADTGSILLQRNQDIIEGKHSREKDLLNINTIIEGRNREQIFCDKKFMSSDYPSRFDHFTSPGLEYLRDNCYTLPNKVLSQEEIHNITHKAIEQGISRMLIATSVANRNNVEDLKTIFSAQLEIDNNGSKTFLLPNDINPNIYVDTMSELKHYAGEEWVKQFTDNIHLIHDKNMDDKKKATWHAAFFPKRFKEDLENDAALKAETNELFGTKQKNNTDITPKIELPVEVAHQDNIGLKVGNLLDKFRKPSADNTNTNKPSIH